MSPLRRSGLGRGLDSLIPVGPLEFEGMQNIRLDAISPKPDQPRSGFADDTLDSLAASIAEVGVLQPIVVRPEGEDRFVIIAGERRWRAARLAGLVEIPAVIRFSDERSGLAEALVENLQREDLTPLEEASAFRQLLEDHGMTHEHVGRLVGKSRATVTNSLRLLTLPLTIQVMLERGALSAGHVRALIGVEDQRYAEHIARRAADEGWSVRQVEEAVRARQGPSGRKMRKPKEVRPPALLELEQRLAEHLGTRVEIHYQEDRGRVVVHFGSAADLERIYRRFLV